MKVTKLTTYRLAPRWMFVKIETDEGVTGWGEPVDEDAGGALARSDRDMAASYREEGVPRPRLRSLLARPEACHEKS